MNRCHYCGYAEKRLTVCPKCHEKAIKELGYGTQKVEEELNNIFKEKAKIIRMDFDTTSTKGAHEKIINDFRNKKYNILLGTQMISKGLDFKDVTLVGVINADTSLMIPNYRSSEYTFDLLSQVAGRSGRSEKEGIVIIQTFNKDHYSIKLAKEHNYKAFFNEEMKIRKMLNYPPFTYIISIKVISADYELVKKESELIKNKLVESISSEVLGPSIGSTFKINNTYRFGILIKYKKDDSIIPCLKEILEHYKNNNKVRVDIDFNPFNI
jgi:primosomal protein N' (replication factor Y)